MKIISLDTNAYSALSNGDEMVKNAIEQADMVWVPFIAVAELLYGFKNGNREQFNTDLLKKFLQLPGVQILHTSDSTPEIYAPLISALKTKGTPIPTNDIWIAALAMETRSTLITYDRHFLRIEKLAVWDQLT